MSDRPDAARKQPLYFVSAPVDYALVGGISIALCALLYAAGFFKGYYRDRTGDVIWWGQALMWVCNWPHFAATNYRLYHSRENIRQYPLTALAIPWLLLAGLIGSIAYPETLAPFFVLIFLLWSPYHFSGQSLGISLIYARRAGFQVGKLERFALSSFIYATFLSSTMMGQVDPGAVNYYGIRYPSLGLPIWTAQFADAWMYVSGVLLLILVVRWCAEQRRTLPPIVLLPALAQFIWFVGAPKLGCNSFIEYVPFFHSMQYLLIAWSMQLKEKLDREQSRPRTPRPSAIRRLRIAGMVLFGLGVYPAMSWLIQFDVQFPKNLSRFLPALVTAAYACYIVFAMMMKNLPARASFAYVVYETLRWFDFNIVMGACLFFVSPLLLSYFFHVNRMVATGVVVAAVQIHHFFVDGVIWKLKRTSVSSPLMVNLSEMIAAPAPVVVPPVAPPRTAGVSPASSAVLTPSLEQTR